MSGNKGNELGEQIRLAIQEGVSTGDFKEMNKIVSATVENALKGGVKVQKQELQRTTRNLPAAYVKEVGDVSGVLCIVFGAIGFGFSALAAAGSLSLLLGGITAAPFVISAGIAVCFASLIKKGSEKRNLISRAKRYARLCDSNGCVNIADLSAHIGQSKRNILKDVRKMIQVGIYPEGHLDADKKYLILSDAMFKEYRELQKARKALEMEQKVNRMQERQQGREEYVVVEPDELRPLEAVSADIAEEAVDQVEAIDNPELAALMGEGHEYILRVRKMNDDIEGEVVSEKLDKLEGILGEIFARVKEHPEQMPQMRKTMNYYLPTTLKLVEAYREFDRVSVPGEDILAAKAEIEKTLDTINQAFGELLNKLFMSAVYDVTADAQVLQTMLAGDGLAGGTDFAAKG